MAGKVKQTKRAIRRTAMAARTAISEATPGPLRRLFAPAVRLGDMLVLDHLFVRLVFPNRHRIAPGAWRAAQPLPYQLGKAKRMGVRTIINLRGPSTNSTYLAEKAECARLGLAFVDCRIRSRAAPSKDELLNLRNVFAIAEHPILFHCKSGADRAGLASTIYLHVKEGVPIEKARRELSLRYGHIRQADTGILDAFFERYLRDTANSPMDFFAWVEQVYDPEELKRSFKAQGWANRLVNGVLHRE
jgi:protein tyrosine/serine phosphatase